MDHQEEYHDPDYAGTSVQIKQEPQSLSEDEKVEKTAQIIRREFTNELEVRENEVMVIDQRQPLHSKHAKKTELEVLVEYLEKNPNLVRGMVWGSAKGLHTVWQPWEELAHILNEVIKADKTYMEWHEFWKSKMCLVKEKAYLRDLHPPRGTEQGDMQLTDIEERILALMKHLMRFPTDGRSKYGEPVQPAPAHAVDDEVIEIKDDEPLIVFEALPYNHKMSEIPPQTPNNQPIAARINVKYVTSPVTCPPPVTQMDFNTSTLEQLSRIMTAGITPSSRNVAPTAKQGKSTRKRPVSLLKPRVSQEFGASQPPAEDSGDNLLPAPRVSSPEDPPPPGPSKPRARRYLTSQANQQRNQFIKLSERFLTLEENRLELDRTNSRMLQTMLERGAQRDRNLVAAFTDLADRMVERCFERDRLIASSTTVIGEGLKALADTLKRY